MHVWHGDYKNTESAVGENPEAALAEVLKTPMGIGYGPPIPSEKFSKIVQDLESFGQAEWGWANYTLVEK